MSEVLYDTKMPRNSKCVNDCMPLHSMLNNLASIYPKPIRNHPPCQPSSVAGRSSALESHMRKFFYSCQEAYSCLIIVFYSF